MAPAVDQKAGTAAGQQRGPAPDPHGRLGGTVPVGTQGPGQPGNAAGRQLAQQRQMGLHPGQLEQQPGQIIRAQGVAQGAQQHALMVGHEAEHDPGRALPAVDGLVEAALPIRARLFHGPQGVAGRPGPRPQGQGGGIGGVYGPGALRVQGQFRHAEGPIAIIELGIELGIAGLGNAKIARPARMHLGGDAAPLGHGQQGVRVGGQQQRSHQIFKGRAAPAEQGPAIRAGPAQPPPMAFGHGAPADGGEG